MIMDPERSFCRHFRRIEDYSTIAISKKPDRIPEPDIAILVRLHRGAIHVQRAVGGIE